MTSEQTQSILDKLDELISEVKMSRHETIRHGATIGGHDRRIGDLEQRVAALERDKKAFA